MYNLLRPGTGMFPNNFLLCPGSLRLRKGRQNAASRLRSSRTLKVKTHDLHLRLGCRVYRFTIVVSILFSMTPVKPKYIEVVSRLQLWIPAAGLGLGSLCSR